MVFFKITGIVIILFGIFIGLNHFEILSDTFFGLNIITIGLLVFIAHELIALFMNFSSSANKMIGVGVPLLFIIIAGSYFIKSYLPELISSNILLIIAVLMIAEGLYRLH